jgi:pimeloyl-ACP methyl ester carboxylesterase
VGSARRSRIGKFAMLTFKGSDSALAICAVLVGIVQTCLAQSAPPYPAPGEMVDVGGYRVHVFCRGEGSPTVIIVGAGFSFDWALVQPEVAKFTKVCTYDPSGTAWSDPSSVTTCSQRVDEVNKLLKSAKIQGPYLLVGLSFGALVGRLYAKLHPDDVTGLVIVDHAFLDVEASPPADVPSPAQTTDLNSPPVLIHKTPIIVTVEESSQFSNLPEHSHKLHRWAEGLNPNLPTVQAAEGCQSELREAGGDSRTLQNEPVIIVSTANDHPNYVKLQTELLSLSRRSKQIIADRSFHSVEIDQPEIVIKAIRQAVDMTRSTGSLTTPQGDIDVKTSR